MKTKLIGIAIALALFVSGALVGVVVDRNWGRGTAAKVERADRDLPRARRHKRLLQRFRKRLNLTDDQVQKVDKILTESRTYARRQRQRAREEIKKVLNPEQLKQYEKMIERRRLRRERRQHRR